MTWRWQTHGKSWLSMRRARCIRVLLAVVVVFATFSPPPSPSFSSCPKHTPSSSSSSSSSSLSLSLSRRCPSRLRAYRFADLAAFSTSSSPSDSMRPCPLASSRSDVLATCSSRSICSRHQKRKKKKAPRRRHHHHHHHHHDHHHHSSITNLRPYRVRVLELGELPVQERHSILDDRGIVLGMAGGCRQRRCLLLLLLLLLLLHRHHRGESRSWNAGRDGRRSDGKVMEEEGGGGGG